VDIPNNGAPRLDDVIAQMLVHLEDRMPEVPLLPDPLLRNRARLVSVRERPVGLASWRGVEVFGSFVPVALKAGRLEAGVLFELWANAQDAADTAALTLHGNLQAARNDLRALGFLRVDGADLAPAELTDSIWRKTAAYTVLYEYQYQDVDGTWSFITRIPVHSDPEERSSPDRETAVVTGRTVRWQRSEDPGMPPPPTLVVRGRTTVPGLSVAAFLPDIPDAAVELLRTFEGATGDPAEALTLQDLATAPHIRMTYDTLALFLDDLTASGDSVELVDLDGNPASYALRTFHFGPALDLPRPIDRLEISTSADAWVGSHAVLYLRAEGA
jgi:hypothetical protein